MAEQPSLTWHCPFGLLSDNGIERARQEGLVVIEPFVRENLGPNSYDVRLSEWFYREQNPTLKGRVFNPFDPASVQGVWGTPQRGVPFSKLVKGGFLDANMIGYKPDDLVILLGPGETILASTEEFIGGRVDKDGHGVVPQMHTRSSMARSFVSAHMAGWGDAGYCDRWCLEITSLSRHHYNPLLVGSRIAQIAFSMIEHVRDSYTKRGSYQQTDDLKTLIETWRPDRMLPKFNPERP